MFKNKIITYFIFLTAMIFTQKAFSQQVKIERLNLKQCVEIALKNNPQILATKIGVSELKQKIKEEQSGFYPLVNLNANAGHYNTNVQANLNKGQINDNYMAGISLHYNLFQGRKAVESVHVARYNYEAGQLGYISSREDLILTVVEDYYRLLQTEHFKSISEKSLQRAQSHLDFAKALFNNGLASRSDILKAKTEQSNAKLDLIHAQNSVLIARGQLNNTLGQNVSSEIKIVDNLEDTINRSLEHQNKFQTLLEEAFKKRPELQKAGVQLQAQKSFIHMAKADYYPGISLDANYNINGGEVSQLYPSNYIGLGLSFPLFSGFSRPARVSQEKLQLQVLEQQRSSLSQQISKEVWNAFLALKEVKERIVNTQVFLKDARENLNISEGEYKQDVGSMLDVLDAETTFVAAEQSYIVALADLKIAQINLQRAINGKYFEEILK